LLEKCIEHLIPAIAQPNTTQSNPAIRVSGAKPIQSGRRSGENKGFCEVTACPGVHGRAFHQV
jgi:hypothetical protein